MLKRITSGLKFDEDMTSAGGDKPILGNYTEWFSGRKFGKPLERLTVFNCAKEINSFPILVVDSTAYLGCPDLNFRGYEISHIYEIKCSVYRHILVKVGIIMISGF